MVDQILIDLARETFQKKGVDPQDEPALIAVVDAGAQMKQVWYAAILLRDVGTPAAIPALKKAMSYPKQDVKIAALCTLADIAGESEASFYRGALTDKQYREKWAALYALARYGDCTAIPDVLERLKKLLAQKERPHWGKETEVVLAAKYLNRFAADPTARLGLDLIAAKWDRLNPPEQEAVKEIVSPM